jgi:ribonuclease Z
LQSEYIVPLGVSAAVPSSGRHFAAVAFVAETFVVLFDCGEGTQFRLIDAGIRTSRVGAIAITHLHGDHYLGLPGLLSTMAMQHRSEPLYIIAPTPLAETLATLPGIGRDRRPFEVTIRELPPDFTSGPVLRWHADTRSAGFTVHAAALDHSIAAYGYAIHCAARPGKLDVEAAAALGVTSYVAYRRLKAGETVTGSGGRTVRPKDVVSDDIPGASFAYVSDTRPCDAAVKLAADVDLLYHESTFLQIEIDRAIKTGHSTAREAGEIAAAARARRLVLGHFSARYDDSSVLADEARSVFSPVDAAEELKRYYLDSSDLNT